MAPGWLSVGWECAQLAGAVAVLGCLALCALPVRPRRRSVPVALGRHERIGWLVLIAAAVHVGSLPALDHDVLQHLKPTMPRYQWAGLLALLMLLFLTLPATGAARRLLWNRHRNFQAWHAGVACLLIATVALHVVATDRYLHGRARAALFLVAAAAAVLALLRARPAPGPEARLGFLHGLVFGRNARLVLATVVVSIAALLALIVSGAALALREPLAARARGLPIDFPHDRHREVACITCHHNFTDRSGDGGCIACHRSARRDLLAGAEARFHDFCLGCHRSPPPQLKHHGPVTGCDTCHVPRRSERSVEARVGIEPA